MRFRICAALSVFISTATLSLADGLIVPIHPHARVRGSWAVKYHRVDIKVRDRVADVSIDQAFVNTGSGVMEAQYLFPIPPSAAIDGLTLLVDGKEFKGRILSAEEARRLYQEIVRTRRDPALLEYVNYGLYRTSAFPLLPGKEVRVAVHYTDICKKDGDVVEVFYPLSTEKFSSKPIQRVEIRTDILEKTPVSSVYSPTHAVTVERPAPNRIIASYKIEQEIPTADFRLLFRPGKDSVNTSVLSYRPDEQDDGYFLLMASPAPRAGKSPVAPKDLVVVLDRSGSMSGDKITQAKASLEYVLQNLNEGDRFNVIAYNDAVDPLFEGLLPAGRDKVEEALRMVDRIQASGGTNIHEALAQAVRAAGSSESGRPKYILFLTDGLPTVGRTNEKTIVEDTAAANGRTRARIFALGIGYDVNVRLLDRLAGGNRGASGYVKERESLEPKISSLYSKLKNPVMTDIAVTFDNVKTSMIYPQVIPDLFEGDQIILLGRYRAPGPVTIGISGTYEGRKQHFQHRADLARTSDRFSYAFVEQLWAVRRIGFLLDEIQLNGRSTEVVDELVRLSKKYGIITPYTSFLADERIDLSDQFTLLREGKMNAQKLSSSISGGTGQMDAVNRAALNLATVAPAAPAPGMGSAQIGQSRLESYEAEQTERLAGVQNIGNRALYRRGRRWIDSTLADRDVARLSAEATSIVQFSDEYFRLAAANSAVENQMLAAQQPGEELIVSLRGRVYRIVPDAQ